MNNTVLLFDGTRNEASFLKIKPVMPAHSRYYITVEQLAQYASVSWNIDPPHQRIGNDSEHNMQSIVGLLVSGGPDMGELVISKVTELADKSGKLFTLHDGGHRSRAVVKFINNMFRLSKNQPAIEMADGTTIKVAGLTFGELPDCLRQNFLQTQIAVKQYEELTPTQETWVIKTVNGGTPMNEIEILNCNGASIVAAEVRKLVRSYAVYDYNTPHKLFKMDGLKPVYLLDKNTRMSWDSFVAVIFYKCWMGNINTTWDYDELEEMYHSDDIDKIKKAQEDTVAMLDQILELLEDREFRPSMKMSLVKALCGYIFGLNGKYGSWKIKKGSELRFMQYWKVAHDTLFASPKGNTGKTAYCSRIGRRGIDDMNFCTDAIYEQMTIDHDSLEYAGVIVKDTIRDFSEIEKLKQLHNQGYKCYITGLELRMSEAEAGHIIAHCNGGQTVPSNMAMVASALNREMGSQNLEAFKISKLAGCQS